MRTLREIDWPDRSLLRFGDDVLLGHAIKRNHWKMQDLGSCGVCVNAGPRRDIVNDTGIMERQIAYYRDHLKTQ